MILVVDASVAVKWFVRELEHEEAFALSRLEAELAAPDRLLLEVANVLHRKVRKSEITPEQARLAVSQLPDPIEMIVPSVILLRDAYDLAEQIGHAVYDCAYLACALHLNATLITADRRFADKARIAGFDKQVETLDGDIIRSLR